MRIIVPKRGSYIISVKNGNFFYEKEIKFVDDITKFCSIVLPKNVYTSYIVTLSVLENYKIQVRVKKDNCIERYSAYIYKFNPSDGRSRSFSKSLDPRVQLIVLIVYLFKVLKEKENIYIGKLNLEINKIITNELDLLDNMYGLYYLKDIVKNDYSNYVLDEDNIMSRNINNKYTEVNPKNLFIELLKQS